MPAWNNAFDTRDIVALYPLDTENFPVNPLGVAPHTWLIEQRIVLAKERPRDDRLSLADIAAECGFCDQSHFTHHFTRIVGVSPGAWRRALKESQASRVSDGLRRLQVWQNAPPRSTSLLQPAGYHLTLSIRVRDPHAAP